MSDSPVDCGRLRRSFALLVISWLWIAGSTAEAAPNGRIRVAFNGNRPAIAAQCLENVGSGRNGEFDLTFPRIDVSRDLSPMEFRDWVLHRTSFGRVSAGNATGYFTCLNIWRWKNDIHRFVLVAGRRIRQQAPVMPDVRDGDLVIFSTSVCNWGGPALTTMEALP